MMRLLLTFVMILVTQLRLACPLTPPILAKTTRLAAANTLHATAANDATTTTTTSTTTASSSSSKNSKFDMGATLFCAGLAFDAYVEPPSDSSRWEKGSGGMNVAFLSSAFTRRLYEGILQVNVERIYDLPDDDDTAESIATGGGVDAFLMVAAIEGRWKEDVKMLEKETYHEGVMGLKGAAHVGKSRTAWANVNENKSKAAKRKLETAIPYHIPSSWGKGGQAIFTEDEPPFYIYIQDPAVARLVFSVMDDDIMGGGSPIGSAHTRLTKLIPDAKLKGKEWMDQAKEAILKKMADGEIKDVQDISPQDMPNLAREWQGEIKLTTKPRIENKNSQVTMGAAAGAMVAGPVGAAAGAFLGNLYEGQVRGRIELKLRYLPIPPVPTKRRQYIVKGGLEGVDWGEMYARWMMRQASSIEGQGEDADVETNEEVKKTDPIGIGGTDLEHCFFINHEETGGSCSVYRSMEQKVIVVSFRGTCAPKDIVTDASLAQSAWVEGEDITKEGVPKVHVGFRNSMNSISRRLKELILAIPEPGEALADYSMYVTGHSLGGALATLFTLDIAESGVDAGRALPQKDASDNWWKSISSTLLGNEAMASNKPPPPPRPKSLRMYNFGSPRVGNPALAAKFGDLQKEGFIDEAYRVVNGEDVVARNPRTMNALALGNVEYEHCAATVLVSEETRSNENGEEIVNPRIWIEGESDDATCPVRDAATPLTNPLADGTLLADILNVTKSSFDGSSDKDNKVDYGTVLKSLAGELSNRMKTVSATDLASVVGIQKNFAEREMKIIQSLASGDGLKHHLEDSYYSCVGRASGFVAKVGEELEELSTSS